MEKKHAAIVDAARTAFLESSYAETSMDSIAKAAKVGIKTVYRHFEDKDDLFIAVIQAACQPQGKTPGKARDRPHSVAGVVPERQYIPEKLSQWPGSR